MFVGTMKSLESVKTVLSVKVAGNSLPVMKEIKSLSVILDSRLDFDSHLRAVCKSHVGTAAYLSSHFGRECTDMACSVVMTCLDYCNSLLCSMPEYVLKKTNFSVCRIHWHKWSAGQMHGLQ